MPETSTDDRPAEDQDEAAAGQAGEQESPVEESHNPDGEQETAEVDGEWLNLGPCHYDQEHEASVVATREDGTGWIAVCDDHLDEAKQNGFERSESQPAQSDADADADD